MKKFLIVSFVLLSLAAGAVAALMFGMPDSDAGQWLWTQYRVLVPDDERSPEEEGADLPDLVSADTPDTPAPVAAPAAPAPAKPKPFAKENWYSGKYLTASDIRGKVVLVYVWDKDEARSVAMLARIQQTWAGFKHKPFTVIGSHRGERSKQVGKLIKAKKVTFPVYQDAFLPNEPKNISTTPYMYVVNPDGKIIYRGGSDVDATEAVVNAISNCIGR